MTTASSGLDCPSASAGTEAAVASDSVTVEVHDHGPGPDDPGVGLTWAQRAPGAGGMGLWLAHRLCSEVTMRVAPDGFRVRLTARAPSPI